MLTYNTRQKSLVLPGYGRNIQRMVDHCLTITDREERNICAQSIIDAMGNLFPELRAEENIHKLWDHLAIMANFQLDIDYPYPVVDKAQLDTKPCPLPYAEQELKYRHYGKLVQQMIEKTAQMPQGEEREAAALLVAAQMKKMLTAVSPDNADDARIMRDLAVMSKGELRLDPEQVHLAEYKIVAPPKRRRK